MRSSGEKDLDLVSDGWRNIMGRVGIAVAVVIVLSIASLPFMTSA
jgi:hypothetical protein